MNRSRYYGCLKTLSFLSLHEEKEATALSNYGIVRKNDCGPETQKAFGG